MKGTSQATKRTGTPPEQWAVASGRSGQPTCRPCTETLGCQSGPALRRFAPPAFTLIELLVVVAIIGILAALLLPSLAGAREKARVVRVHSELLALGLALEMYADDNGGRYPPTRASCNASLADHWCQFPVELAEQGYVRRGSNGLAANVEDLFHRGHSYKYSAPGPMLLNGDWVGNREIWVPEDLPVAASTNGSYHSDPRASPVRWVIWSLGPQPDSRRSLDSRAPLSRSTWYERTGGDGVLVRFATRDGTQFKSP